MALVVRNLAFGMTWYTSTSDSRDEIKTQAKRVKANVFTEAGGEHGRVYGFATLKKWKAIHSAAGCLADSLGEGGVFIHKLDSQGSSCLIAIDPERRLPVPGMDLIGPRAEMIERAKDYMAANDDREIKVFGDISNAELPDAHEFSLERLASEAVTSGELKPVTQVDARFLLAAMAMAVAAATWYSDDISAMFSTEPTKPVESLEAQYRNQVKAAVTQVVQLNQFPSNVMAGYLPFLETVASDADGWKIESLKCIDTNCEAIWRRRAGATSEGFLRALNVAANDPSVTFYDVDYAKRTMTFKKAAVAKQLVLAPNATFSEIVGSWLQGLADRQLERPTIGPLSPLVAPNGATLAAGESPQVGQYRFTVPFKHADLQAVVNLPDVMTIESIEVRREGETKMTVQFNGKYYVL